ncbi:translation initiation factor 2 [Longispora albida]|uniref:translation initiation factor 2 n=1 Tax=Longispora albida TaxID=203523 RepID=UPI001FE01A87|nr:translation initiation factor 2 [Longispora albida]
MSDPDQYWRRPAPGEPEPPAVLPAPPAAYAGPPRSAPPPPGWRPPIVLEIPPPRQMPAQDHPALDSEEKSARTITYGVALIAGSIFILMTMVLCARAVL